jgi:hypothetical protein
VSRNTDTLSSAGKQVQTGQASPGRVFKSLPLVHQHLVEEGYKLALSTLYKHQKGGHIRPDGGGQYSLTEVESYIGRVNLKRKGDTGSLGVETARGKALAEARLKEAQADRLEHTLAVEIGKYVPREAFEQALAGRAQLFRTDLRNLATGGAGEVVALVSGAPDKIPDLIEYLLGQFDDLLDRYARNPELLA